MTLIVTLREALRNIFSAKLRTLLAILGILVGTGSVVALISSSQLATDHALAQFKTLGTNLISVNIYSQTSSTSGKKQSLELTDMSTIQKASKQIQVIAPYITTYSPLEVNGKSIDGQILAATDELQSLLKINLKRGRFISFLDEHAFFAVVGSDIAKTMRDNGMSQPIGKQIKVGNYYFTIVGIAQPWPQNMFMSSDINQSIVIPLKAAYLLSSDAAINNILFSIDKKADIDQVQNKIKAAINNILPHANLYMRNPKQIIAIMGKQRQTLTLMLAMIGSISLIVGGIGVMNIMLVSVIERKQEIGIRMAIGSKRKDILWMFMIEAVTLTVLGGLIGILVGEGITITLAILSKWEYHLYLLPPLLGFSVSVLTGLLSGIYPAFRASRLDPIQCLTAD